MTIECEIESDSILKLVVCQSGQTEYTFSEELTKKTNATLRVDRESNWGVSVPSSVSKHENILSNVAYVSLPVGPGKLRLCNNCYSVTHSVKVRHDCESFSFCSVECMASSRILLDNCAELITRIRNWNKNNLNFDPSQYSELSVLLILFLHECSITNGLCPALQGSSKNACRDADVDSK
jgi:hypothetical protein